MAAACVVRAQAVKLVTGIKPEKELLHYNHVNELENLLPYYITLVESKKEVVLAVRCVPVRAGQGSRATPDVMILPMPIWQGPSCQPPAACAQHPPPAPAPPRSGSYSPQDVMTDLLTEPAPVTKDWFFPPGWERSSAASVLDGPPKQHVHMPSVGAVGWGAQWHCCLGLVGGWTR